MRNTQIVAALLTIASTAAAQEYVTRACSDGRVVADLGYSGTTCGNCILDAGYIQYLTEPSISQIRSGGPADGKLRENDVLVAVDGSLITTRQGWRRMYDLRPDEPVTLTVRRDGVERDVTITPGSKCDPVARRSRLADRDVQSDDDASQDNRDRDRERTRLRERERDRNADRFGYSDSVAAARERADDLRARLAERQAERSREAMDRSREAMDRAMERSREAMERSMERNMERSMVRTPSSGDASDNAISRRGWLGIAIECSECGAVSVGRGDYRWSFREEPRITSVVPGGPAARAGMHAGDVVVEIDGRAITSPDGGRRWGSIHPGDNLELVVRRGNARRNLSIDADSAPRARVMPRVQVAGPAMRFWRLPPNVENAIIAGRVAAGRDTLTGSSSSFSSSSASSSSTSRYDLDGATVELEGKATDVRFDRETGEIVITGPDFTVRVKSKSARP